MSTSVLSGLTLFGKGKLATLLSENDCDSCCSEMDNRIDSDYSLSDIEEGLDEEAEMDDVQPEMEIEAFDTTQVQQMTRPKSVPCIASLTEHVYQAPSPKLRRRSLSVSLSSEITHGDVASANTIVRRKSSRHAGMQEIEKHYTATDSRLWEIERNFKSKLHFNDKIASFDKREKLLMGSTHTDIPRSDLKNQLAKDLSERRDRKQVDSGYADSNCSEQSRSVSDSYSPTKDMNTVSDFSADSVTAAAVKKWKHYKRAMSAYRKSSEKNNDDLSPGNDDIGPSSVMSLPVRVGKNDVKRQSIFNFWDKDQDQIPEVPEMTTQTGSNNLIGKDAPVEGDMCILKTSEKGDMLSFDYRSLLRTSSALKKCRGSPVQQLKLRDSNRFSVESDIITDIDAIAGFSPSERCSCAVKEQTTDTSGNQPEKIVWSHYDNYFKPRLEVSYISLNDAKKRSSGSEDSKNSLNSGAKTRSVLDLRTLSADSDSVNLRDQQLIRKRNLSSSTLLLSHSGETGMPPISPSNDAHKFHTVASAARLAKLVKRQQRKSAFKHKVRASTLSVSNVDSEKRAPAADSCGSPTAKDLPNSACTSESLVQNSTLFDKHSGHKGLTRPTHLDVEQNQLSEKKLARKFRLGSNKSRSLPQLQVIGANNLSNTGSPLDGSSESFLFSRSASEKLSSDSILDGMSKLEIHGNSGFFATLTRRRLSSPFHKIKNFKSSTKRRSIKASDIVHTQLNTNANNNSNNNNCIKNAISSNRQVANVTPLDPLFILQEDISKTGFTLQKFSSSKSQTNISGNRFKDTCSLACQNDFVCRCCKKPPVLEFAHTDVDFFNSVAGNNSYTEWLFFLQDLLIKLFFALLCHSVCISGIYL